MKNSAIEWTDHTFNPWIGCTKVSDGCKHCYAETMMDKRWSKVEWGPQGTRVRTSAANWKQPLKWNREAEAEGVRQRVFCASLADVFEDRPELAEWRRDLFELIYATPHLDWLMLTKRPENVIDMVPADWYMRCPPNIGIGTSVENQAAADERIPHLLSVPARVRFLSMEPLLGPVDLTEIPILGGQLIYNTLTGLAPIDPKTGMPEAGGASLQWVIVGGESGPQARPMHPDWVRSIRDQCQAAGVPFFFKQWGEWIWHYYDHPVENAGWKQNRVGKRVAGRMLDGREWSERPQGEATR